VVPVKKKKKAKKVVTHPEPDPADLGLGKGPPAPATVEQTYQAGPAAEAGSHAVTDTPNEAEDEDQRYQVPDTDEFRNVWGSDR